MLDVLNQGVELVQVSVPEAGRLAEKLKAMAEPAIARGKRPLLLEYFFLTDELYAVFLVPLWKITEGEPLPIVSVPIKIDGRTLQSLMINLRECFDTARHGFQRVHGKHGINFEGVRNGLQLFEFLAQSIGAAFIRPLATLLEEMEADELVIVPHGILHVLPLHAGRLPSGRPLIDRWDVSYLTSDTMASFLIDRQSDAPAASDCLVMGPPDTHLTGALAETEALAADLGLTAPYVGDRMLLDVLRDKAPHATVAHLATHSGYDAEDYLMSYIEFFDGKLTLVDLISDIRLDFRGMKLFYLNSCESGLATPDADDEIQGLIWALTYAGSQAVLGTLWAVEDETAKSLARSVYQHWRSGSSLAGAFSQAVRGLSSRELCYWAPFVLYGNGFSFWDDQTSGPRPDP